MQMLMLMVLLGKINDIVDTIHAIVQKMQDDRNNVRETLVILDHDHPRFKEANLTLSYNPLQPHAMSTTISPHIGDVFAEYTSSETSNKLLQSEIEVLRRECNEKLEISIKQFQNRKHWPGSLLRHRAAARR
jgi:hypothetical protein